MKRIIGILLLIVTVISFAGCNNDKAENDVTPSSVEATPTAVTTPTPLPTSTPSPTPKPRYVSYKGLRIMIPDGYSGKTEGSSFMIKAANEVVGIGSSMPKNYMTFTSAGAATPDVAKKIYLEDKKTAKEYYTHVLKEASGGQITQITEYTVTKVADVDAVKIRYGYTDKKLRYNVTEYILFLENDTVSIGIAITDTTCKSDFEAILNSIQVK